MRTFKIYFLSNFQIYNIINYSHDSIHDLYICNWKFVIFYSLHPFCPPISYLFSVSVSCLFFILDSAYNWDHMIFVFRWLI